MSLIQSFQRSRRMPDWNPGQDAFLDLNGARLHYLAWGQPVNPPLLLLHGFTNCAATWTPLAQALSKDYYVLALDQRGHGDSAKAGIVPGGPTLADDVSAFIDALGLAAVDLLGHSMGGNVALKFAAAHPARVKRLVVEDIGPEFSKRSDARLARIASTKKETYDTLEEVVEYLKLVDPLAPEAILKAEAGWLTRRTPSGKYAWKHHREASGQTGRKTAPQPKVDRWEIVRAVRCPTLIIRGAESDILDADLAPRMAAVMADARLVEIPGAGHYVHRDQYAAFEAAVLDFLGPPA
jgi:pimeloyl-ACP methyl ester carboxylesterase